MALSISEKSQKVIYNVRQNNPELAEALDEVQDVLIGIMGVTESVAHNTERPLNDTGEHQAVNAALDAISLAHMALESVYEAVAY